jgi:hypothetical protein
LGYGYPCQRLRRSFREMRNGEGWFVSAMVRAVVLLCSRRALDAFRILIHGLVAGIRRIVCWCLILEQNLLAYLCLMDRYPHLQYYLCYPAQAVLEAEPTGYHRLEDQVFFWPNSVSRSEHPPATLQKPKAKIPRPSLSGVWIQTAASQTHRILGWSALTTPTLDLSGRIWTSSDGQNTNGENLAATTLPTNL